MASRVEIVGLVDVGCREKNDDRILIGKSIYKTGKHNIILHNPCVVAVCDGVGGSEGGDEAAEHVLTKLAEKSPCDIDTEERMKNVLSEINSALILYQQKKIVKNGMRTTLVGLNLFDDKIIFYNSGDSRLYRYRNHVLKKLSEDHSIAQEMIDRGIITENCEKELMNCSRITRCLGVEGVLPPFVQQLNHPALPNDVFLLCSDGLWGVVSDDCIEMILNTEITLEKKVDSLYNIATQNSSQDNISIILARIEE
ncbi:MAG: PP2C family protein-serine/threonine phosphatase [Lachnospiraceae bacterium]